MLGNIYTIFMTNFQKKNNLGDNQSGEPDPHHPHPPKNDPNLVLGRTNHVIHHPQVTTTSSQMLTTNQSQRQNSSTSTTSSSSTSTTSSSSTSSSSSKVAKSSQKILKKISNFSQRLRSSMENLVDRYGNGSEEANLTKPPLILPLRRISVTSTDGSPPLNLLDNLYHGMSLPIIIPNMANLPAGQEIMKYKQKNVTSASKTKKAQQQRQTVTSTGIFNHEKHMAPSSQSSITITSKSGVSASKSMINAASAVNQLMNGMRPPTAEDELLSLPLDDLDLLCSKSNPQDVNCAIAKYCSLLDNFVERLKASADGSKSSSTGSGSKAPQLLNRMNEIIRKAWAVPTHGHELGYILCNTLRTRGGLDLLMSYCVANDYELQFSSAKLLEQCLTTENLTHVVENGLEKVVNVACMCTKNANSVDHARVGT